MFKHLWHLLFDTRYVAIRRWRPFHLWFAWDAYLGGSVDVDIQFIPAHKARFADEDDDISWGPELKLGATLLWVSFGLTVPNDDHPDNEIKMPPRHCVKCGAETEPTIAQRCPPCDQPAAACECQMLCCLPCLRCDKDCCSDCGEFCQCESHECVAGLKIGGPAALYRTETTGVQSAPIPALKPEV